MAFAIMVHRKHHSWSDLGLVAAHNRRSFMAPNIDPARVALNRQLQGDPDVVSAAKAVLEAAGITTLRKNGVLAIELLLSASPDFFRPDAPHAAGTWRRDRLAPWVERAMTHLRKTYGANLISAVLHLDEATPHIHAVVIPIDRQPRKKGKSTRLNAARWIGSPAKLRQAQTDYHAAVADLGLQRGQSGSNATHTELKDWYQTMGELKEDAEIDREAATRLRRQAEEEARKAAKERDALEDERRAAQSARDAAEREAQASAAERRAAVNDRLNAEGEFASLMADVERDRVIAAALRKRAEEEAAAYTRAIQAGLAALAEGAIVGAEDGPERRLVWAPDVKPERRRQISDLIQPAFDAVWTMVRTLSARMIDVLKTANETANSIMRRAQVEAGDLRGRLAKREQALAQKEAQIGDDLASVDRSQAALETALGRVRGVERNLSPAQARAVQDAEAIAQAEKARVHPIRSRFEWAKEERGR